MAFDGVAFGRRLSAARAWAGKDVKEIAHALGRSAESIYALERGDRTRPPSKVLLEALASEVKQDPEWLLDGEVPPWRSSEFSDQEELRALREEVAAIRAMVQELVEREAV